MATWPEVVNVASNAATAIGVFFAAWQIWLTKRQSVTAFEDAMAREYRELTEKIPVRALLDEELTGEEYSQALDHFFRYFDLSNEQAFLRQNGRVTRRTWLQWCDGIQSNLRRPTFAPRGKKSRSA